MQPAEHGEARAVADAESGFGKRLDPTATGRLETADEVHAGIGVAEALIAPPGDAKTSTDVEPVKVVGRHLVPQVGIEAEQRTPSTRK